MMTTFSFLNSSRRFSLNSTAAIYYYMVIIITEELFYFCNLFTGQTPSEYASRTFCAYSLHPISHNLHQTSILWHDAVVAEGPSVARGFEHGEQTTSEVEGTRGEDNADCHGGGDEEAYRGQSTAGVKASGSPFAHLHLRPGDIGPVHAHDESRLDGLRKVGAEVLEHRAAVTLFQV